MTTTREHRSEIIRALLVLWNKSPELRLGQLIAARSIYLTYKTDSFYIKDEDLVGIQL